MGEHYPKAMVGEQVPAWCERCRRVTEHRIVSHSEHAGRLGHCVDPKHPALGLSKEQQRRKAKAEEERQNPRLF